MTRNLAVGNRRRPRGLCVGSMDRDSDSMPTSPRLISPRSLSLDLDAALEKAVDSEAKEEVRLRRRGLLAL